MTPHSPRAVRTQVRRSAVAVAAIALSALALTGCAGTSSSSSAGSSEMPVGAPAQDGSTDSAAKAGFSGTGTGTTSGEVGAPLAVTADRSIVVRADLSVRVDNVARSTSSLATVAAAHAATVASQSTSSGKGPVPVDYGKNPDGSQTCPTTGCPTDYASSTTVLRVDNRDADALIKDVSALGTVEASTRTSDDVTADVADVAARVRNAEASLARVRLLMERAVTVGDVVALEGEMSKREADLEALQARQRTLADQTAQATVTVRLVASDAPVVNESSTGFLAGLKTGWDGFTGAVAVALTVVGALVPWLIVLVPFALILGYVLRRRQTQHAATAPTPAPPVTDSLSG